MLQQPESETATAKRGLMSTLECLWQREGVSTLVVAGVTSTFAVGLVASRAWLTGRSSYNFLLWNLFLAWVPIAFAMLSHVTWTRSRIVAVTAGVAWLAFFPNAGYVITDLMHLRTTRGGPIWLDTLMVFSIAWASVLAGVISLRIVHNLVRRSRGAVVGWLFTFAVSIAAGFGVFLGRFQRWNSWDIVTRPDALVADTLRNLTVPRALVFSLLFGALLWLVYFSYVALSSPRARDDKQPAKVDTVPD